MSQRLEVRSLYRRLMHLSKTWMSKGGDPVTTESERAYIRDESRILFRKNLHLTDPQAIGDCIKEGEARIEIALHYKIPYPRPVNLPPMSMAKRKGKEQGIVQERIKKQSKPIYIKSFE